MKNESHMLSEAVDSAVTKQLSPIERCRKILLSGEFKNYQDEHNENKITLNVCIYKAILENNLIKASLHNIASAKELIKKAESIRFGKFSFNIFASKYNDTIADFFGKDQAAARNITFDIPFYAGGSIKSARNQAMLVSSISRFESERIKQEVAFQTIAAYLKLLLAQGKIAVGNRYLQQTNLQLDLVQSKISAGTAVKSDKFRIDVARNQAKINLISAENEKNRVSSLLNLIMAGDLQRKLTAVTPKDLSTEKESVTRGSKRALIKRPELLAARLALKLLKEELVVAKSKLKPSIGLNAVYGDINPTFAGDEDSTQLTLGARFPLFEGGGMRAHIHKVQNDIKEEKEKLRFFEQKILFEVTEAHISMTEAKEQMSIAVDNVVRQKKTPEYLKSDTSLVQP